MKNDDLLELWDLMGSCNGDKEEAFKILRNIVTNNGQVNVDLQDVITTLTGVRHFSVHHLSTEDDQPKRINTIIQQVNELPKGAQRKLIYILSSDNHPLTMNELSELHKALTKDNPDASLLWGKNQHPDTDKFEVSIVLGFLQ